tara:strand:+ start:359 stop:586 length:228 start_codon:yes stop_codon:yes gene_type:complete
MEIQRYRELREMAEGDEDIAQQLAQEMFLDPDSAREREAQAFEDWAMKEGERYIAENAPAPDEEEIDRLSDEIDF